MTTRSTVVHLALLFVGSFADVSVTELTSVHLPAAAVTTFVDAGKLADEAVLLATTFSPTTQNDAVLQFTGLTASKASGTPLTQATVDGEAVWPNQADFVPAGTVAGGPASILGAGGFFVAVPGYPSKATGSVDLYEQQGDDSYAKRQISTDKTGYFFHKAEFVDANGDGQMDVIGARVTVPNFGSPKSELVMMAAPTWEETVLITDGPDVFFALVDLDGNGQTQVVATEYFVNQRLALYSCGAPTWAGCVGGANVTTIVVDDSEGAMFDLTWIDLNGDGVKEILASSQGTSGSGKVLVYEKPPNWVEPGAAWTKTVIADGYKPTKAYLPGRGSPGSATPFASPTADSSKPWIAVSADDGGWVDLLSPASSEIGNFTYDKTRIIQSTGTIGQVACGDVDGDGVAELFVPLYDEDRLAMYSLNL